RLWGVCMNDVGTRAQQMPGERTERAEVLERRDAARERDGLHRDPGGSDGLDPGPGPADGSDLVALGLEVPQLIKQQITERHVARGDVDHAHGPYCRGSCVASPG